MIFYLRSRSLSASCVGKNPGIVKYKFPVLGHLINWNSTSYKEISRKPSFQF
nr:MAG TPA: hypothetical protein [Caudoviricetes sp.]